MAPIAAYHKEYPPYVVSNTIKDEADDHPRARVDDATTLGPLLIPPLVFGAATLSHHYNDVDSYLQSDVPFRVVRLALRYGIAAFDTSPYYGSSEIVLGQILQSLASDYPRTSYKLMTKCGRYGFRRTDFDYSPETLRESVQRSLKRLNTDYLDVIYLHDVEFVASPIYPDERAGNPGDALGSDAILWGLDSENLKRVRGEGDQMVLRAIAGLFKMKDEGFVRAVGITGYSLPILLRLASLIASQPALAPLDAVLTFCHSTLQNSSLQTFLPLFREWGQVTEVLSASPLAMGLLTGYPPSWHPAPELLREICKDADEACKAEGLSLAALALRYGLRFHRPSEENCLTPVVLGLSTLDEVHQAVEILNASVNGENRTLRLENIVKSMYRSANYYDWAWPSPP